MFSVIASCFHKQMGLQEGMPRMAGHDGHGLLRMDTPGCSVSGSCPRYEQEYTAAIAEYAALVKVKAVMDTPDTGGVSVVMEPYVARGVVPSPPKATTVPASMPDIAGVVQA